MFDIGFSELVVIGTVALIVIGPERLPRVARTMGHLLGRLQRYVADVKADISREMELEELRKMRDSMQESVASVEATVSAEFAKTGDELKRSLAPDDHGVPSDAARAAALAESLPEPAPEPAAVSEQPPAPCADAPGPGDDRPASGRRQ